MEEEPMNQWRAVLSSTKNTSFYVACYLYHSPGSRLPHSPHYPQPQSWKTDSQVQAERLCRRRHVADLPGLIATPGVLPMCTILPMQAAETEDTGEQLYGLPNWTLYSDVGVVPFPSRTKDVHRVILLYRSPSHSPFLKQNVVPPLRMSHHRGSWIVHGENIQKTNIGCQTIANIFIGLTQPSSY